MKVLLINPPPYDHAENSRFLEKAPIQTYTMPLGLGYIASYLEKHGYEVSILDAYVKKLSYEEIESRIREMRPEVIGITCLSDQRAAWFRLIDVIRATDSAIKIVLGGAHPSLLTEQVLKSFSPDVVVLGEGEETMLELIEAWENKRDLSAVKGIAYLQDGRVITTLPRERIKALDDLPFPAYHLVDLGDYQGWEFLTMLYGMLGIGKQAKYASVSTSRGCVGECGYCSSPLIWKRRWTQRSAKNIADEMEKLHKEYNVEFIIMTDDIFTINQARVTALCEELARRNLNLMWGFETAVQFVSPDLLQQAKKAGCCCILFGVESGSKAVLSNISKKINREDVLKAFRMTKEAGILTGAFLMVGNPGESEKSISETIDLLREIEPDIILPQITMITPGTKIYSLAEEKGCIHENFWITDLPFPYYTCERDLKTLLRWYRKLFNYKRSNTGIRLRTIRDYIELHTGVRISRKGITKAVIPQ